MIYSYEIHISVLLSSVLWAQLCVWVRDRDREIVIWVLIENMIVITLQRSSSLLCWWLWEVVLLILPKPHNLRSTSRLRQNNFNTSTYAKRSTSQTGPPSTPLSRLLHHLAPLRLLTEVVQVERSPLSRILVQPSTKAVALWLVEVFVVLWLAY